jgi:hypothetical protein
VLTDSKSVFFIIFADVQVAKMSTTNADVLRLETDLSALTERDDVSIASDDDIIARIRARAAPSSRRQVTVRRISSKQSPTTWRSPERIKSPSEELHDENSDTSTDSDFYDTDLEAEDPPVNGTCLNYYDFTSRCPIQGIFYNYKWHHEELHSSSCVNRIGQDSYDCFENVF